MHFLICFDKEHRRQTRYRLFVVMPLIDNVVSRINSLCSHPNIRDESSTKSEVRYSIIGRISCLRFWTSCGLSFGLSLGELSCICFNWFLVHGISLPAAQVCVIAIESILWEGVGNLTRTSECRWLLPAPNGQVDEREVGHRGSRRP